MWQYDRFSNSYVPGTLPADGSKISILYARLSQADDQEGDSESIANQRDFLFKYAFENQLPSPRFFFDDGYTGTNFDRPDFKEAMAIVEAGQAANFVVKDYCAIIGLNQKDLENQGILA